MSEEKKKKERNPKRLWTTIGIVAVVFAVAGFGFYQWHEQPSFCASFCHNMDEYLETYSQEQGVAGVDKYGNEVSNTNAMMATLHRQNQTTALPTITCLMCHVPTIPEQMDEGIKMVTGNYYDPLDERWGDGLTHWRELEGTQFCANENCHSYLLGNDGLVDRKKLEHATADMDFNPHDTYHAGQQMECTNCHKGHRASVVQCTACHEHEKESVPDGWLTAAESDVLVEASFNQAA